MSLENGFLPVNMAEVEELGLKPTITDQKVISHNNIVLSLTDPSNIILDHKARDVAEYS